MFLPVTSRSYSSRPLWPEKPTSGRLGTDERERNADSALDGGEALVLTGFRAGRVGSADGSGDGPLELHRRLLAEGQALGQPDLRASIADVADVPQNRVVQCHRVQGRNHVGGLAGEQRQVRLGPQQGHVGVTHLDLGLVLGGVVPVEIELDLSRGLHRLALRAGDVEAQTRLVGRQVELVVVVPGGLRIDVQDVIARIGARRIPRGVALDVPVQLHVQVRPEVLPGGGLLGRPVTSFLRSATCFSSCSILFCREGSSGRCTRGSCGTGTGRLPGAAVANTHQSLRRSIMMSFH